jgi:hypothetical protein
MSTVTVLWPRVKYKTRRVKLSKLQRLACLGITGDTRTAAAVAVEVLLELPSPQMKMDEC